MMQCKDIPTKPILEFLLRNEGRWCNWYFGDERDVHHVMPQGVPDKLVVAKMRSLIKKGYIEGCDCGCRGDYEINKKGKQLLAKLSVAENTEE